MHKINLAAVQVIAGDARSALVATDQAIRANAQMMISVVDGVQTSELPINVTQNVYEAISASNGNIIAGRAGLRRTLSLLTAIKDRSDQREVALGCPGGTPEGVMFMAANEPVTA